MATYKLVGTQPFLSYGSYLPYWGWCKLNGTNVTHSGQLHHCRELVANEIRRAFLSFGIDKSNIDCKKACLLSTHYEGASYKTKAKHKQHKEYILKCLRFLNIFEKNSKWPLTQMYEIDYRPKEHYSIYLIIGDKRWLRSPHILSLWLLLMRVGRNINDENFELVETSKGSTSTVLKALKQSSEQDNSISSTEMGFIKQALPYTYLILQHHTELFKGLTTRRNFCIEKNLTGSDYTREGISKLCSGYTRDKKLFERLMALKKKYGKGKPL
jgi:hypothetical protein